MEIKKIAVAGGGLSGWITALWMKKNLPNLEISLFCSKEIDKLITGEGGLPIFLHFFQLCDIDLKEFFQETGATVKLGVKFKNWNQKKSEYVHPFTGNLLKIENIYWPDKTEEELENYANDEIQGSETEKIKLNKQLENNYLNGCFVAGEYSKFANPFKEQIPDKDIEDILKFTSQSQQTGISLHFDADKTCEFFKKKSLEIGVKYYEEHIVDTEIDIDYNTTTIVTEKDNEYQYYDIDFVFDCSGFSKIIMEKYNSIDSLVAPVYIPYHYLTTNTAIPFSVPDTFNEAWTEATALNYGWLWKIPLQHKTGYGYVFDNNYCSIDEAKKELKTIFGDDLKTEKPIQFEAGYLDQPWFGNVIAIGLSQSFLEPLEATSLGFMITQLFAVLKNFKQIQAKSLDKDEENSNDDQVENFDEWEMLDFDDDITFNHRLAYNNDVSDATNELANFIFLHYITNKDDTEFWTDKRALVEILTGEDFNAAYDLHDYTDQSITLRLSQWYTNHVHYQPHNEDLFILTLQNWLFIIDGIDFYDIAARNENLESIDQDELKTLQTYFLSLKDILSTNTLTQKDYLKKYELIYTF